MVDVPDEILEPRPLAEQAVRALAEKAAEAAAERAAVHAAELAAERTAEKVVEKMFLHLGIDVSDKVAMTALRDQIGFLARMERGAREVKSAVVKTCVGSLVTGIIAIVVMGFLEWIKKHG